ncbi:DUF4192 family protein [Paeniglutamicibacter gangotriensis]|uniref:DUF4192 domain-containing protein n=1 Tax=Paeniglutamicibacter gangotriensis Lz1y TaxID=1276920 RepID=M7NEC6_9MICC|nr:DUF4192 family protein [Paeniglutamicibacter gangotriensis]EMQ96833.1 hypothetical protein ADIAG_03970 [Paeniglutamicibacter gangotriensis Lz1y]
MDKITATTMADTVAVAIHSLGFTPTSSVVLMLLEHRTVAATLRLDAHPEAPAGFWATEVRHYVDRLENITGVLLLSFEDDRAMTPTQYRALGGLLARTGRPIRHAVLIRDGYLTDYEGTHTDQIPFATVATSNAALALMVGTKSYVKLAADIPPCSTDAAVSELQQFVDAARRLDCADGATRTTVCTRLIGIVIGYQCTGTITPNEGAWLGGTCTNKGIRDLIFASLATTSDDMDTISAALMGDISPDDWEYFRDGADAIYTALEYIPLEYRTDLLAGLGWTRWIDGKGSEAMHFLDLARTTDPTHRLTELLTRLIISGRLPASATTKH